MGFTDEQIDRIIQMAWEDRTPFEAIEHQFGIKENDVRKIIGPPSSKSTFNNSWLYFERKKTNQSLFKLGKKTISRKDNIIFFLLLTKKFLIFSP